MLPKNLPPEIRIMGTSSLSPEKKKEWDGMLAELRKSEYTALFRVDWAAAFDACIEKTDQLQKLVGEMLKTISEQIRYKK